MRLPITQAFLILMGLAFCSAFVLPSRYTNPLRAPVQGLFIPVSAPAARLANWAHAHWANDAETDPRKNDSIVAENVRLRNQVSWLIEQNRRLAVLAGEKKSLGDLNKLCQRFSVGGSDTGNRETLQLIDGILANVREGQPVLYFGGLAGRIDASGQVRLLTDPGFNVSGKFVRFVQQGDRQELFPFTDLHPSVFGMGQGRMRITMNSLAEVKNAQLAVGDWVVLSDDTWPAEVQGKRIGKVESIAPRKDSPLFAEIKLAPETALIHLSEVFVLVGKN